MSVFEVGIGEPGAAWWAPPVRFREARRGVRYSMVSDEAVGVLLNKACIVGAWAAMGPELTDGAVGPWVAYDTTLRDQRLDVMVCERRWPLNLGDRIWLVCELDGEAVAMRREPYGWDVVVSGESSRFLTALRLHVENEARSTSRGLYAPLLARQLQGESRS